MEQKILTVTPSQRAHADSYGLERIKGEGMKANDKQVGGNHYSSKKIQPWDFIVSNDIGFLAGNAIKYLARYKDKNGEQDIRKAIHYCEKLLETEYGNK
jgi:hypothetical protein